MKHSSKQKQVQRSQKAISEKLKAKLNGIDLQKATENEIKNNFYKYGSWRGK